MNLQKKYACPVPSWQVPGAWPPRSEVYSVGQFLFPLDNFFSHWTFFSEIRNTFFKTYDLIKIIGFCLMMVIFYIKMHLITCHLYFYPNISCVLCSHIRSIHYQVFLMWYPNNMSCVYLHIHSIHNVLNVHKCVVYRCTQTICTFATKCISYIYPKWFHPYSSPLWKIYTYHINKGRI